MGQKIFKALVKKATDWTKAIASLEDAVKKMDDTYDPCADQRSRLNMQGGKGSVVVNFLYFVRYVKG